MFKDFAKKGGYTGMFIEAEWNCPPVLPDQYELNTWLSAKLMCDPGVNIEPLIREFLNGVYGKAAPMMTALLELKKNRLPYYPFQAVTFDFMKQAQDLMASAEKTAAGDPVLLGRLRDVRINLDLVVLQYRHQLRSDYLASGGKPEDYPWPKDAIRQSILDTLENATNYWWQVRFVEYWKSSPTFNIYTSGKVQFHEMLKEYLDIICQGGEMMPPLPPELAGIPRDRIVDLAWPQLLGNTIGGTLDADPTAAMGMAFCVQTDSPFFLKNGRTPIYLFLYDYSSTVKYAGKPTQDKHGISNSEVHLDKLKEGGYHWYSCNPGKIGPATRTVATKSWGHQVALNSLYDPANPDQEWKVYWSIRLAGPNYPFGHVYERDAILIDRMILVKCAPGEKLPEMLTARKNM